MKFTALFTTVVAAVLVTATTIDDNLPSGIDRITVQYCKGRKHGPPCKNVAVDENVCTNVDPSYNDRVRSMYPSITGLAQCQVYRDYNCEGPNVVIGIFGEDDFDNQILVKKVSSFKCKKVV